MIEDVVLAVDECKASSQLQQNWIFALRIKIAFD